MSKQYVCYLEAVTNETFNKGRSPVNQFRLLSREFKCSQATFLSITEEGYQSHSGSWLFCTGFPQGKSIIFKSG